MDQLLHDARALSLDHAYALAVIGIATVSVALLHCAERWGAARARTRTARAIAEIERSRPPGAQT
jgi:hypothetical protein